MSEDGNEDGPRRGRSKPSAEMAQVRLLLSAAEDGDGQLGKVAAIHRAANGAGAYN